MTYHGYLNDTIIIADSVLPDVLGWATAIFLGLGFWFILILMFPPK